MPGMHTRTSLSGFKHQSMSVIQHKKELMNTGIHLSYCVQSLSANGAKYGS